MKEQLACIQIVMINTTLPANIGSASRAMHTMGLSKLTLVAPKLPIDESSVSCAMGGIDVLRQATEVATLDDAIADSQLVFAASSRSRNVPRPVVNPVQASQIMADFLANNPDYLNSDNHVQSSTISILFGREDRGLTNQELAMADYHIQIDANPDYPVLNVASAVQVISSFIYSHFNQLAVDDQTTATTHDLMHSIRQEWDNPAINHQQQQQLILKVIELMQSLELADHSDLKGLPHRLSRLSSRLQLDNKEYQILLAIISKLQQKVDL